jgi:hypothetical protein
VVATLSVSSLRPRAISRASATRGYHDLDRDRRRESVGREKRFGLNDSARKTIEHVSATVEVGLDDRNNQTRGHQTARQHEAFNRSAEGRLDCNLVAQQVARREVLHPQTEGQARTLGSFSCPGTTRDDDMRCGCLCVTILGSLASVGAIVGRWCTAVDDVARARRVDRPNHDRCRMVTRASSVVLQKRLGGCGSGKL